MVRPPFAVELKRIRSNRRDTQEKFVRVILDDDAPSQRVKLAEYELGKAIPKTSTLNVIVDRLNQDEAERLVQAWIESCPDLKTLLHKGGWTKKSTDDIPPSTTFDLPSKAEPDCVEAG